MRVSLATDRVLIDGYELPEKMTGYEMAVIAGKEISRESIPIYPSRFRHVILADQGIKWCLIEPNNIVTSFELLISPTGSECAYTGLVDLNGCLLSESIDKGFMDSLGLLSHMGTYFYKTANHEVAISFQPSGDPPAIWRRIKLTSLSINFIKTEYVKGYLPRR